MAEPYEEEPSKRIPEPPPEAAGLKSVPEKADSAALEANQLTRDKTVQEIKNESDAKEAMRQEKFKQHFECLVIGTMYVIFFMLFCFGMIWFYHMVAPEKYRWLIPEQVVIIQDILTGSLIAGLVADHIKRRMR